jgi:hypothetical protein
MVGENYMELSTGTHMYHYSVENRKRNLSFHNSPLAARTLVNAIKEALNTESNLSAYSSIDEIGTITLYAKCVVVR